MQIAVPIGKVPPKEDIDWRRILFDLLLNEYKMKSEGGEPLVMDYQFAHFLGKYFTASPYDLGADELRDLVDDPAILTKSKLWQDIRARSKIQDSRPDRKYKLANISKHAISKVDTGEPGLGRDEFYNLVDRLNLDADYIVHRMRETKMRQETKDYISTVTDQTFDKEVLASHGLVLVVLGAPWCPQCRYIMPELHNFANEFEGKIKVALINSDENKATVEKVGLEVIPYVLLYKDGKKVGEFKGKKAKEEIISFIDFVAGVTWKEKTSSQ